MIKLPQTLSYEFQKTKHGRNIHFISTPEKLPGLASIIITTGFGSNHLKYKDKEKIIQLPVGMAHFMEHYLFWSHMDEQLVPCEFEFISTPNAFVTYEKTVWGIKNAFIGKELSYDRCVGKLDLDYWDEKIATNQICLLLKRLLSVLVDNKPTNDKPLSFIINDIKNEIGERHSNFDYRFQLRLLESLYKKLPIRHDILGTHKTLSEIKPEHILLGSRIIRSHIQSVIIVCHKITSHLITQVMDLVTQMIPTVDNDLCYVVSGLEDETVFKQTAKIYFPSAQYFSSLLFGVKLPSLKTAFPQINIFRRLLLLTHLLFRNKSEYFAVLTTEARAYIISGRVPDLLFYFDPWEVKNISKQMREKLFHFFYVTKERLPYLIRDTINNFDQHPEKLMRYCQIADNIGLSLLETIEILSDLNSNDIDYLIEELNIYENNTSLVYSSIT